MAWSKIQGHDPIIQSFADRFARGRMAHAYLFVGPEGVGKKLFAIELAKTLLCENPPGAFEACDTCDACVQVDARTHPDFHLVARPEDKNELPIEVIRDLCKAFMLKSARGSRRIAIADDADDLNEESANSFLKTLEEPPLGSLFILIGTNPQFQLPTIRSRCHTVRFAPLSEQVMMTLQTIKELPADLVPRIIPLAQGSPGRAVALADTDLWDFRDSFLKGLARSPVPSVELGKKFAEFAEDAGKETVLHRRRALLTMLLIVEAFRNVQLMRLGGSPKIYSAEDRNLLTALTERMAEDKIAAILERCLQCEEQINRYVQLGLVLEGFVDALGQILEPQKVPAGA